MITEQLNSVSLLVVLEAVLRNSCFNAGTGLTLRLSIGNSVNLLVETVRTLLSPPGMRSIVAEKDLNFFNSLAAGLRIGEPELECAQNAEGSEEEEQAIFDVAEGRRNEKANGKIELLFVNNTGMQMKSNYTYQPVTDGCNTHTCGTGLEGPDLSSVNPADGSESKGIYDNEEIREGNDRVSGRTSNSDQNVGVAVDTLRNIYAVRAQDTADDEVAKCHSQSTIDQQRPSANLVNEEKHDRGEDDEQSVLHSTSNQVDVARKIGHVEDINDVVCICQLSSFVGSNSLQGETHMSLR